MCAQAFSTGAYQGSVKITQQSHFTQNMYLQSGLYRLSQSMMKKGIVERERKNMRQNDIKLVNTMLFPVFDGVDKV